MKTTLLLQILVLASFAASGQAETVRKANYNLKKGIALEGYDPVSYFYGTPKEGRDQLKFAYHGVTYLFSSTQHLNAFKSNPEKYEPAYGGWCAYAMGDSGEKVKIDPETYKIIDGKLYLFYNFWGNNTLQSWNKDEAVLKAAGNRNWEKIVNR